MFNSGQTEENIRLQSFPVVEWQLTNHNSLTCCRQRAGKKDAQTSQLCIWFDIKPITKRVSQLKEKCLRCWSLQRKGDKNPVQNIHLALTTRPSPLPLRRSQASWMQAQQVDSHGIRSTELCILRQFLKCSQRGGDCRPVKKIRRVPHFILYSHR